MRTSVLILIAQMIPLVAVAQEHKMQVVVDFTNPHGGHWTTVNDGVMGGLSMSAMELSRSTGVILRVRGDGRRYQLRFHLEGSFDGVAHKAEFDTQPGEWMEGPFRLEIPWVGARAGPLPQAIDDL